jgi:hypothetical protein
MAALLVCHGKVSRPKTPQFVVSSSPQQVAEASKGKGFLVIHICRWFTVSVFLLSSTTLLVLHEIHVGSFISTHPGNVGMYGLFNSTFSISGDKSVK